MKDNPTPLPEKIEPVYRCSRQDENGLCKDPIGCMKIIPLTRAERKINEIIDYLANQDKKI